MKRKTFISTIFGFILGCLISAFFLYSGMVAGAAGDGVYLPLALGFGFRGFGFILWPLIGGFYAHLYRLWVRILCVVLLIVNYAGSFYFFHLYSSLNREFERFSGFSALAIILYVVINSIIWSKVINPKITFEGVFNS